MLVSVSGVGAGVGDDCALAVWRFAAMISEMLKVRDGRIRRILARGSTEVKVASSQCEELTAIFVTILKRAKTS